MKKILSLILAIAMVSTMIAVPVFAETETEPTPTATVTASLVGEVPQAGETFTISVDLSQISSNMFKGGGIAWAWPSDVASLYDVDYEEAITDVENAAYAVTNLENPRDGRKGKYLTQSRIFDLEKGIGGMDIYIDAAATGNLQKEETLTDGKYGLYDVNFILNEGQSYDDFYFEITAGSFTFTKRTFIDVIFSTIKDGYVTPVGIKAAAPAVSYYDEATGTTYKAVSNNLVEVNGIEGLTNAANGGALTTWEAVDATTVNPNAEEGAVYVRNTSIAGGNTTNTMRTFFPIEGGKTYYVTHTIYNNTGAKTENQNSAGMAAIVATGAPVYGTFSGLTFYSHVNYGGYNSWSNENGPTFVGDKTSRYDIEAEVGYNKINAIINAPEGAENIMISYGAWGKDQLYYGDWAIYEVEASEVKEEATATFNYTCNGEVVGSVEKSGFVGDTVKVEAGTYTAEDGTEYAAEAAEVVLVKGENTVVVECAKLETVTINYTLDGEVVGTKTVEGVDGADVEYAAFSGYNTTAVYEAAAGTLTVDAEELTKTIEVTVLYEGMVAANKQVEAGKFELPESITDKATVSFDLVVINAGDAGVLIGNGDAFVDGAHYANAVAQMNIGAEVLKFRNGGNNEEVAVSTHGNTYHVVMTIDNANGTWGAVVTDAEGATVAEKADLVVRNTAEVLDTIVVLDNGDFGGTIVVQNLKVEKAEGPVDPEPTTAEVVVKYVVGEDVVKAEEAKTYEIGAYVEVAKDTEIVVDDKTYVVTEDVKVEVTAETTEVLVKVEEKIDTPVEPEPTTAEVVVKYVVGEEVVKAEEAKTYEIGAYVEVAKDAEIVVGDKTYVVTEDVKVEVTAETTEVLVKVEEKIDTPVDPEPTTAEVVVKYVVGEDVVKTEEAKTYEIGAYVEVAKDAEIVVGDKTYVVTEDVKVEVTAETTEVLVKVEEKVDTPVDPEPTTAEVVVKYVVGEEVVKAEEAKTYEIGAYVEVAKDAEIVVGDKTYVVTEGVKVEVTAETTEVLVKVEEKIDTPVDPIEPDATLPLVASKKDSAANKIAVDFELNGEYTGDLVLANGAKVIVVVSYMKDGKPYFAAATSGGIIDGIVEAAADIPEGCTVIAVSVLYGTDALSAITGELGYPAGVWK